MEARNAPLTDLPLGALTYSRLHKRELRRRLLDIIHLDTPVVVVGGKEAIRTVQLGAAFKSLRKREKDDS
jgi:hypothetical protein